jgi:hypothetical protein
MKGIQGITTNNQRCKLLGLKQKVFKSEPLAKVYAVIRMFIQNCVKVELHKQVHDIVGLRVTTSQEDANEAQGKNIMVDGDSTAKPVSPS